MALVYLTDYGTAPSAFVTMLREVERHDEFLRHIDRFSIRDLVRDVFEWKTQRDMVARLLDPRPRELAPAFFDEPLVSRGRTPASPRACARSYPPPKRSFYQGDF